MGKPTTIGKSYNHVSIDRTKPFNPAKFIGNEWTIWKGSADDDGLTGAEEQDEHSLALTEVDISQIRLETCLKSDEPYLSGEENLLRLKSTGHIRLDAKVFQTFWENQHLIPELWKEKISGYTTYIFFDGTILRIPDACRYALCFYWCGGRWRWDCHWLDGHRYVSGPSAVLASEHLAV